MVHELVHPVLTGLKPLRSVALGFRLRMVWGFIGLGAQDGLGLGASDLGWFRAWGFELRMVWGLGLQA